MTRALIVGCGYLGREVASRLFVQGWDVTAWTQSAASAAVEGQKGFRVSAVDVTDLDWVRKTGDREGALDWIIFCASTRGGDAERYRNVYLHGAANLIRGLCFGRILFTSSTSVFGQTDGSNITEEMPVSPATETAEVLAETERLILSRNGVVARLGGIYSAERCALLRQFQAGQITSTDDRWLNTIHRDDAVSAISTILDSVRGQDIFHVTDNGNVTHRQAVEFLQNQTNIASLPFPPEEKKLHAPPNRRRGRTNKRVSNAKLRSLGWQSKFPTFLDGLKSLLT
ncbi:MAG TPA: NAD-dependent epimerase/dehydratase family protein [Chthoniobacterales bacterium]